MPDHEFTGSVQASPDAVFGHLADIANLPGYLPLMTAAREVVPGEVEMYTRVNGNDTTVTAWFRPDADARTIEWGSTRTDAYTGRLEVTATADGEGSLVHFRVTTPIEHTLEPYLRAATTFVANAVEQR